jgi:hypothetical protein
MVEHCAVACSMRNWPIQAAGGRIACIMARRRGIKLLAPVHRSSTSTLCRERNPWDAEIAKLRVATPKGEGQQ